ncbi:MAG: hypothetical protein MRECE_42c014 [Mycoplasmataceae bacterium CE_OT135]|nr:MAG: hypothetical protein MRECE_42c014 [Mycoplasmataceae bacterium CE_OT135]
MLRLLICLLTLSLFLNLLLALVLVFWFINKNCSQCQQEMNPKRIFALKDKCQGCERSHHE